MFWHSIVTNKAEVERRCKQGFSRHKRMKKPKEIFNLHLIGVDSVSRLNFLRNMVNTQKFIQKELSAYEMRGYNKVADNTFPNMVAFLTGKFISELGWSWMAKNSEFDNYSFIWKNFSAAGYRTLYSEDSPNAIFNNLKVGFKTQPTDYYLRPLTLAMQKVKYLWSESYCFVDRQETTMLLDHVREYSRLFSDRPHFGFTFISTLTHDKVKNARFADFQYIDFFRQFKSSGHFNNTVIFFFSDHGMRYGKSRTTFLGNLEERLPFNFLIFPDWFSKKYPQLSKNLRTNSKRLTTPFDMYETMQDILNFDGVNRKALLSSRGISLLREIPKERSCGDAGILPHWCSCLQKNALVPIDSDLSDNVAESLVAQLNNILSPVSHLCARLSLDRVTQILNKTTDGLDLYQVTLFTKPGEGQFEATMTFDSDKSSVNLEGEISRINAYGNQSICVKKSLLKKYCFCLTNKWWCFYTNSNQYTVISESF